MGDQSKDHRADELLDVVEPTGQHVARLPRSKVHAEALWHQVFHCLVVRSSLPARVLLQRRKRSSLAFPGMLDLSVSGHLVAGERPLDGIREVREETGLVIDATRLVSLGRRLLVDDSGEGRNREIAHVFLLTDDTPLEDLRLESNEVAGFVEVTINDLLRMLEDPSSTVEADEVDTDGIVRPVTCTGVELVPAIDGYWIVLATMAERHIAGFHPLGI